MGTERSESHRDCLREGEEEREGSRRDQRVWRERPSWRCEQISSMAELRRESMEEERASPVGVSGGSKGRCEDRIRYPVQLV